MAGINRNDKGSTMLDELKTSVTKAVRELAKNGKI